jgi:hypothetical protein
MRSIALLFAAAGILSIVAATCSTQRKAELAPNGIALPDGYEDWRVIGVSQRTDNNTLRVVLGNDIAVDAARAGNTNPWPEGSVLAKLVWKNTTLEAWRMAIGPGEFIQVEFMIKESSWYSTTGGWGFARWLGAEKKPYGEDASFVQECFACHTPVKDNDYVFTRPVIIP